MAGETSGLEKSDITESCSLIGRIPGGKLLQDTIIFCYILANQISYCNSFGLFYKAFSRTKKAAALILRQLADFPLLTKGVSPFSFASPDSPGFAIYRASIAQEQAGMQGKLLKFRCAAAGSIATSPCTLIQFRRKYIPRKY